MSTERLYNRLVLQYLDDLRGVPQSLIDVDAYVHARVQRPCLAYVERAVQYLEAAGYIAQAQITAADDQLWKITVSGIHQAQRQVRADQLDPMVWG